VWGGPELLGDEMGAGRIVVEMDGRKSDWAKEKVEGQCTEKRRTASEIWD